MHALVKVGVTVAAILFVAGCATDTTTQPSAASARPVPTPASVSHDLTFAPFSSTATFTIYPNRDTYVLVGTNVLYVPAGAVCDPATSGYGPDYWSAPCTPSTTAILVHATAATANGHPIVEFDQHLRFRPGNDSRYFVTLFMYDPAASAKSNIVWCPNATPGVVAPSVSGCVDETTSLLGAGGVGSAFDAQSRLVFRRILHFSGYNVTAGDDSTGNGQGR